MNRTIAEGEDAGGAIMKKLYRIHSRYVLEINDNMKVDISDYKVDVSNIVNKKGSRGSSL
jgi:hypothetical protein